MKLNILKISQNKCIKYTVWFITGILPWFFAPVMREEYIQDIMNFRLIGILMPIIGALIFTILSHFEYLSWKKKDWFSYGTYTIGKLFLFLIIFVIRIAQFRG